MDGKKWYVGGRNCNGTSFEGWTWKGKKLKLAKTWQISWIRLKLWFPARKSKNKSKKYKDQTRHQQKEQWQINQTKQKHIFLPCVEPRVFGFLTFSSPCLTPVPIPTPRFAPEQLAALPRWARLRPDQTPNLWGPLWQVTFKTWPKKMKQCVLQIFWKMRKCVHFCWEKYESYIIFCGGFLDHFPFFCDENRKKKKKNDSQRTELPDEGWYHGARWHCHRWPRPSESQSLASPPRSSRCLQSAASSTWRSVNPNGPYNGTELFGSSFEKAGSQQKVVAVDGWDHWGIFTPFLDGWISGSYSQKRLPSSALHKTESDLFSNRLQLVSSPLCSKCVQCKHLNNKVLFHVHRPKSWKAWFSIKVHPASW